MARTEARHTDLARVGAASRTDSVRMVAHTGWEAAALRSFVTPDHRQWEELRLLQAG